MIQQMLPHVSLEFDGGALLDNGTLVVGNGKTFEPDPKGCWCGQLVVFATRPGLAGSLIQHARVEGKSLRFVKFRGQRWWEITE